MATKRKVEIKWQGKMRLRAEVTCDCGRVFIVYNDGDVCDCGQMYNFQGSKITHKGY